MPVFQIKSDVPNLELLREDLQVIPGFASESHIELVEDPGDNESLRHADRGTLFIDFANAVAAAGFIESIKYAVQRARRRGHVESLLDELPFDDDPPETPPGDASS